MNNKLKYNDQELLLMIKSGDGEAFETLYYRYFENLVRTSFKKVQNETIAEEIVQDVFVDVWNKRFELDETQNVAGFLFALLRNKSLHALRSIMIQSKHLEAFGQISNQIKNPEINQNLDTRQLEKRIDTVINGLSPQCREAFKLSRFENLPYKEIAIRMQISVNTVEKHIGKALQILRTELQKSNYLYLFLVGSLLSVYMFINYL